MTSGLLYIAGMSSCTKSPFNELAKQEIETMNTTTWVSNSFCVNPDFLMRSRLQVMKQDTIWWKYDGTDEQEDSFRRAEEEMWWSGHDEEEEVGQCPNELWLFSPLYWLRFLLVLFRVLASLDPEDDEEEDLTMAFSFRSSLKEDLAFLLLLFLFWTKLHESHLCRSDGHIFPCFEEFNDTVVVWGDSYFFK